MKILHTSDWHLGQELYSYDRSEEHLSFFEQLEKIVSDEQPDVMVVSGDIYHNAAPSNTVMRMFTDGLDRVRRACPGMHIVVTAGNHDSCSRLEVNQSIWSYLDVSIVGRIRKVDGEIDFDSLFIPVPNREGQTIGYVVALPFILPNGYPNLSDDVAREDRAAYFYQKLNDHLLAVNTQGLPVVMMSHLALTGSDITGHDRICGGMDFVSRDELAVDYDYLALGHIHCPQDIVKNHVRYSGSPVAVSFDENYVHSVSIVEIAKHGETPEVKTLPIDNPWPLKTIPDECVPLDEALKYLKALPDDQKMYIRLRAKLTNEPPKNAIERAQQEIKGKAARFCCFKWEREEVKQSAAQKQMVDVDEFRDKSPLDIADLYYRSKHQNEPMPDEMREMMTQVIERVEKED